MPPARGRPKKRQRNISGLRNQKKAPPQTSNEPSSIAPPDGRESGDENAKNRSPTPSPTSSKKLKTQPHCDDLHHDSSGNRESDEGREDASGDGAKPFEAAVNDEEFAIRAVEMAVELDSNDPDWIPERLRRKEKQAAQKKREP